MIMDDNKNNKIFYEFSDLELKELALFFRKNIGSLPHNLEPFSDFTENYVYGKMTIAEAEQFFKDSIG